MAEMSVVCLDVGRLVGKEAACRVDVPSCLRWLEVKLRRDRQSPRIRNPVRGVGDGCHSSNRTC